MTEGQATLGLAEDAHATLAEGPVWDAVRGVLWWVDISEGIVPRVDGRDPRSSASPTTGACPTA